MWNNELNPYIRSMYSIICIAFMLFSPSFYLEQIDYFEYFDLSNPPPKNTNQVGDSS